MNKISFRLASEDGGVRKFSREFEDGGNLGIQLAFLFLSAADDIDAPAVQFLHFCDMLLNDERWDGCMIDTSGILAEARKQLGSYFNRLVETSENTSDAEE